MLIRLVEGGDAVIRLVEEGDTAAPLFGSDKQIRAQRIRENSLLMSQAKRKVVMVTRQSKGGKDNNTATEEWHAVLETGR
mmetsp:Transcript_26175/g.36014  ORF Transcript_26175/g.36014 Transcript_26175/m.36014 type:complete len:80 (+) Transcript_26175:242-481(+)